MKKSIMFLSVLTLMALLVGHVTAEEIAPGFALTDIDGTEFALSEYRGKIVVLDFFAIFCSSCVEGIPHLSVLQNEFTGEIVVISISITPEIDTVEKLRQFRQAHNMSWIVARDTVGMSSNYSVQIAPTLVIIDKDGYIRYRHVDPDPDQMETLLRQEILEIIPEFGTWVSVILILSTVAAALVIHKRRTPSDETCREPKQML